MQFSFAKPQLPVSLRLCRSLVLTQGTFVLLGGAFVAFTAVVFGADSSIPFRGENLSGGRAVALGAVYAVAGMVLLYLGIELGRLARWATAAIVSVEVFLAVLLVFRSFELSVSVVFNGAFLVSILWLLWAPATRLALSRAMTGDASPPSVDGVDAPTSPHA